MKKFQIMMLTLLAAGAVSCGSSKENGKPNTPDETPITSDVECYVTTANGASLFEQKELNFSKVSMSPNKVELEPETVFQTIDGFGPAVTGASCYNLLKMSAEDRAALLRKCFDPKEGVGFSFIRVHIGGSDFSMDEYTYCDTKGIEFFETPALERDGIFPVLREILAINPDIKILGSPWSCPKWMKGTVDNPSVPFDSWTSGRLNPAYYQDYAEYFVKWVQTWEAEGFPIYAITMQNEPLNHGNSMSLYMPWEDQLAFVKVLGPAFQKAGLKTKILVFDHNYNYDGKAGQEQYPLHIYNDAEASQWVDGSAWHNYGGDVSELDRILAAAPDKSIYFTEASIGSWNYTFDGCLINDFESIFLGTLSRMGKGVLLWNMMLDNEGKPYRPGGCSTCYGAIEINSSDYKTLKFNSHYYDLAHCSKVIRPGAQRIGASDAGIENVSYLAFRNTDGSYAMIVLNRNAEAKALVVEGPEKGFRFELPAQSVVSFRWSEK